jgi:hypothetical protein
MAALVRPDSFHKSVTLELLDIPLNGFQRQADDLGQLDGRDARILL